MSTNGFKNTWRRRETVRLDCPSGSACLVRRPGPEMALAAARLSRTLKPLVEASERGVVEMPAAAPTEAEERATFEMARVIVAATVVEPKLYLEPLEGQLGVDDIEIEDFWFIFQWASGGARDVPVETTEGSTTVEAVETFPPKQGAGPGFGDDGGDLRGEALAASGD